MPRGKKKLAEQIIPKLRESAAACGSSSKATNLLLHSYPAPRLHLAHEVGKVVDGPKLPTIHAK